MKSKYSIGASLLVLFGAVTTFFAATSGIYLDGKEVTPGDPVPRPVDFSWSASPTIYRGPVSYFTDVPWSVYKPTTATKIRYVDVATGSDSDNGTTWPLAWKTLNKATAMAAADNEITLIYVKAGYYGYSDYMDNTNVAHDLAWVADGGKVITSTGMKATSLSWSAGSTYTNTYHATRSASSNVIDHLNVTADGNASLLTVRTSEQLVDENPGSYYINGSTVYVRTIDSREPDSNIEVMMALNGPAFNGAYNYYFEGIEFRGGNSALYVQNASRAVFNNCAFNYARTYNGLDIDGCTDVFVKDSEASENNADGFNYHTTMHVVEENCQGYGNGNAGGGSNNGSSIHDNHIIVRAGCRYGNNNGPQIADIAATSESINVGVYVFDPVSVTTWQDTGFYFEGEAWLFDCSVEGALYDVYASVSVPTKTMGTKVRNGYGLISPYI